MMLLLRLLINAVSLLAITQLVDGFAVDNFYYALIAALVLGLVNAVIRPIIHLFTFPITLLTLGLFSLVINAVLIWFVSTFLDGFTVDGFLPALFAAILLWIISTLTNIFLKSN
jgi:putative membrane protein